MSKTRGKKMIETKQIIDGYVKNNVWAPGDEYLTVTVQVDSSNFSPGDSVKVTIEKSK